MLNKEIRRFEIDLGEYPANETVAFNLSEEKLFELKEPLGLKLNAEEQFQHSITTIKTLLPDGQIKARRTLIIRIMDQYYM